jgi:hypothetical protein
MEEDKTLNVQHAVEEAMSEFDFIERYNILTLAQRTL